jgi:hypothetical protein
MPGMPRGREPVYLESASKRTFALAVDWPGWARAGRGADEALVALVAYRGRYASVPRRARIGFAAPKDVSGFEVVETIRGNPTTEFGAPGMPLPSDADPLDEKELKRLTKLLVAAWETFDEAAASAKGVRLRLGPRGGGRSVAKMIDHVLEAEGAYLGALGARPLKASAGDPIGSLKAMREEMLATLAAVAHGEPIANPRNTKKRWSPRYTIRRSAWHALDHAWEIEDRSGPEEVVAGA